MTQEQIIKTNNQEIIKSYMTGYNGGRADSKIEFIEAACEWIINNKHSCQVWSFGSFSMDWDKFIREFRKAMEER